jgi:hypothetical protein
MTDIMINEAALSSAVKAALAVEMLRDLVEVDRDLVEEEARTDSLNPEDVFVLHFEARVNGRPVRSLGKLLDDIDAKRAPAVENMRLQLRSHGVANEDFDAAVRRLLRGAAS